MKTLFNKFISLFYYIFKPIPKYSTTVSDDLIVKEIPKQDPVVIEAFYYLIVEPNNFFELIENTNNRVTLMQLSTGKTIKIRMDLFNINFRQITNINNHVLENIMRKSKQCVK